MEKNLVRKLLLEFIKKNKGIDETVENERAKIFDRFSPEKILPIGLDSYCIGKNLKDSFCYLMEYGTKDLGGMGGGNAQKYGVYFRKDKNRFVPKETKRFKCAANGLDTFEFVKQQLYTLMKNAQEANEFHDFDTIFNGLFKYKIISVYNKNLMVPVFNESDLDYFLNRLEIKGNLNSLESKHRALIGYMKEINPNVSTNMFGHFLYRVVYSYCVDEDELDLEETVKQTSGAYSPKREPAKIRMSKGVSLRPRNAKEAEIARFKSGCVCEACGESKVFISRKTDNIYLETHHLIPRSRQDDTKFKNIDIDVAQNIVCLCSNCHNKIHYGKDWKDVVAHLYKKRIKLLNEYGIDLSLDELFSYYVFKKPRKNEEQSDNDCQ